MEQVTDSSRFFAVRVVDSGRKAMLGIGFEERSEAFDFGVSLQEVRRHNDFELNGVAGQNKKGGAKKATELTPVEPRKDYSLKEGETINITIGVIHCRKHTWSGELTVCRIRDDVALRVRRRWTQSETTHYRSCRRHRVPRTSSGGRVNTAWRILGN